MPWEWYLYYGDASLLKESYPAMQRYVDYLAKPASVPGEFAGGITEEGFQDKVRGFLDLAIQPYVNPFFNGNPFVTNPRRGDKILVCGAEAIIPLYRGLELNFHYYYVRNNSNIPLYDYNRHIGGGMMGYRY